jgi:thiamine-phosphate diphosphorylase/hydroxyethylthiazole kinase
MAECGPSVPTVAIGGINKSNVQRVMFQSQAPRKALDGIAVVSAIIAAKNPKDASQELRHLVASLPTFVNSPTKQSQPSTAENLVAKIPEIVTKLVIERPICHNMTNLVVQNFAANVAIAM